MKVGTGGACGSAARMTPRIGLSTSPAGLKALTFMRKVFPRFASYSFVMISVDKDGRNLTAASLSAFASINVPWAPSSTITA